MRYTTRRSRALGGFALGALVLLAVACNGSSEATPTSVAGGGAACPAAGEEFETTRLYIEHNATDEDTGVHGSFGGVAWSSLCIRDPEGTVILEVSPRAQLGDLTLSDLFFESREPENDEYSVDDLLTDFPAGDYEVGGVDFEGVSRVGAARFAHAIAAEPEITLPALGDEPEGAPVVGAKDLTVSWEPVTETIEGDPVSIVAYEVIVTKEEHDDPDAASRPEYDVHVPPVLTSLAVPGGFLEADTIYELEVIAIEESGNQTISVGFFRTE